MIVHAMRLAGLALIWAISRVSPRRVNALFCAFGMVGSVAPDAVAGRVSFDCRPGMETNSDIRAGTPLPRGSSSPIARRATTPAPSSARTIITKGDPQKRLEIEGLYGAGAAVTGSAGVWYAAAAVPAPATLMLTRTGTFGPASDLY
jgi:hypothetical protein